jgi:electron transport complex protein RnfD
MTSWPTPVENQMVLSDAVTGATSLGIIKEGVAFGGTVSELTSQIPSNLDLFLGISGGSIGEMSALALLLGGVYLLIRRVITWHIPITILLTMAVLTGVFW